MSKCSSPCSDYKLGHSLDFHHRHHQQPQHHHSICFCFSFGVIHFTDQFTWHPNSWVNCWVGHVWQQRLLGIAHLTQIRIPGWFSGRFADAIGYEGWSVRYPGAPWRLGSGSQVSSFSLALVDDFLNDDYVHIVFLLSIFRQYHIIEDWRWVVMLVDNQNGHWGSAPHQPTIAGLMFQILF